MGEKARVAILMGSKSDLPVVEPAVEVLEQFGVPFELRVMSAHRSPEVVREFASGAEGRGLEVVIAAAGGAAHLAGVVAACTALPVIAVPVPTSRMGGMDSLLSAVQMPGGVPVACMGLGKSGAKNAALMAVKILAVANPALREALKEYARGMCDHVGEQDGDVQQWLAQRRDR